ncbi:glycosyltransferase family 4 protein [Sporosarcina jiandibaonis]|uniref:glycosyltransferase family 4 protein n=1 Tax=Sporosarcina jiandibaonis TaxID=2715535 RepID=UPI0015553651|nr:glycosyltransferase family 4 protein [Sporosarcina jiandibaonis]
MRICHLTSVHSHTDTRIFVKECQSLSAAGFEVHLVAPGAPDCRIEGVQIHGITREVGSRLKRMTKTVNQVYNKALEIDAEVYHFHDPELIPIGLKLKKRGKKVVYDVHEDVPRQILTKKWIPKYTNNMISKIIEAYENYASKKFDVIITATPFIRDRFLNIDCNAVDINNYPLLEELKVLDIQWSEKENAVCYVGGIAFIRGIKEMVKSLEMKSNISLLLAGKFFSPKEKEAVMKLNGWKKVKELGFLDREGVKDTYRKSKAGIVTLQPTINYIDALPVKMFEYMAAGIPVIASNFPLWKDILNKNKCGLIVDPMNPKEIAEAISWVLENPIEAEQMGQNGRKAVETEYNWEKESEKLIKVYKNLLRK